MKMPVFLQLSMLLLTATVSFGPMIQSQAALAQAQSATPIKTIKQWFNSYDQVRRQAQMNPQERAKADQLLSTTFGSVPPQERQASKALLKTLIARYDVAIAQLKGMRLYPETGKLHRGYYQYFTTARALFADCLAMQGNILAVDQATGKPVATDLIKRKQELTVLDESNKQLDAQLRQQFGIPPYRY